VARPELSPCRLAGRPPAVQGTSGPRPEGARGAALPLRRGTRPRRPGLSVLPLCAGTGSRRGDDAGPDHRRPRGGRQGRYRDERGRGRGNRHPPAHELLPQTDRQVPSAPEPPPVPEAATPMPVEYIMHVLSEVLPEDAMLADESASSKAKFHRYVRPSRPGGYFTSAAGGLGYCLSASVRLKLANPERPVVCVIGDGPSRTPSRRCEALYGMRPA
jgi:hypothetical protein